MAERGRPRAFDRTVALRGAMEVFWELGYEGAKLTDLTGAMNINSASLYNAFGSKEQLFREAVELYGSTTGSATARALRARSRRPGPPSRPCCAATSTSSPTRARPAAA